MYPIFRLRSNHRCDSNLQKHSIYPKTEKDIVGIIPPPSFKPPGNRTLSCRAYLCAQDTDRWSCRLRQGEGATFAMTATETVTPGL
ncbi:hypothetical protein NPIL_225121 [Nephila pilipes]|uniref:Uncharacterized protein n=1 Tax=Nephila pilipes TaxID=299642 RepID=A0A8X6TRB3_NEPPI|nr:hypothetical protein NPIL_225121 [Nephila pilipes]